MMILALGSEWLVLGARPAPQRIGSPADGARLGVLSRYSSAPRASTVAWHPEHSSIGVATFEGDPRHAATLLERKLRAQGEIASDVKILILETQQVGRGYQVLYVTVALDEWQQMLSWAGAQHHICRLALAASLAFKQVQHDRAVVLHAGRHFHFFARHDGQLIHLQAVSVDDTVADFEAVASMLGNQVKEEMAARGCHQFKVLWVPANFKGTRAGLEAMVAAFAAAAHTEVALHSAAFHLPGPDAEDQALHSGLLELAQQARPKDLLNEGNDKMLVLASAYLPYGAVMAVLAAMGLAYVGYGWVNEAASLRQRTHAVYAEEAQLRETIAAIARDTAVEKPAVNRQVDTLHLMRKVQADHDPVDLLRALQEGAQGGVRILSMSAVKPGGNNPNAKDSAPAMVVDGTLPENAIHSDRDSRALSTLVRTLEAHGYQAEPIDIRSSATGRDTSTRLFSYRVTRMEPVQQGRP